MRIEYFQLIDRIVDLNLNDLTIRVEANVPTDSTIFEGHFPGRPLMPGVLLIEAMAQASGWLIIGRTKFAKMPFLAALKEVKLRTFVTPGQALVVTAKIMHEGSGFALTEAEIQVDGKTVCNADITFRVVDFPRATSLSHMHEVAQRIGFPMESCRPWLTPSATLPAKPGSPASASCRASARARTPTGRRSEQGSRRPTTTYPPYIIHKIAPLEFDKQIPKKGDQRQMEAWQRIGTYAAGLALDSAGVKGNTEILARTDMIVAAGGGERDIAADTAILSGLPARRRPRPSSTNG